jgi:UDP-N-acetylmuramoylalanine--D-glutamate ligase
LFAEAQAGDTVILSPGLASFGLFRNEFDRGSQFRAAFQRIRDEVGE